MYSVHVLYTCCTCAWIHLLNHNPVASIVSEVTAYTCDCDEVHMCETTSTCVQMASVCAEGTWFPRKTRWSAHPTLAWVAKSFIVRTTCTWYHTTAGQHTLKTDVTVHVALKFRWKPTNGLIFLPLLHWICSSTLHQVSMAAAFIAHLHSGYMHTHTGDLCDKRIL